MKMKNLIAVIVLLLAASSPAAAQIPFGLDKVKEIKLLESTRDDVRRIFADYSLDISDDSQYYQWFSTNDANIRISYSDGKCSNDFVDWNISEWKVEEIEIAFKNSIKLKDSRMDFSNYRKEGKFINLSHAYIYHNKNSGIAFEVYKKEIWKIYFNPSRENYSLLCENEKTKAYHLRKSWFADELKERIYHDESPNYPADVTNLILSLPEITADCSGSRSGSCSGGVKAVAVFAIGEDLENDSIVFGFTVSGGRIIEGEKNTWNQRSSILRRSAKVVWDLSGVHPGTYTITAAVDDGCGFCGETRTKTVTVKECADCDKK